LTAAACAAWLSRMFKSVHPVCPVTDMGASLAFWARLGFAVAFADRDPPETADYAGVARDGLELHLQTFTPEQRAGTQTMAIRIEMTGRAALEALHGEWAPHGMITAELADKPWGTREFGFYDPDGTPFFFYVDRS